MAWVYQPTLVRRQTAALEPLPALLVPLLDVALDALVGDEPDAAMGLATTVLRVLTALTRNLTVCEALLATPFLALAAALLRAPGGGTRATASSSWHATLQVRMRRGAGQSPH
jgi:hypothetical protein